MILGLAVRAFNSKKTDRTIWTASYIWEHGLVRIFDKDLLVIRNLIMQNVTINRDL
jgi:hypothetical protein